MKIIKQIYDVDFAIADHVDEKGIHLKKVHGDVLIVKGLIKDDPEALMTLGIVNGETDAQIAFYKPIDEIEKIVNGKRS